MIDLNTFLLIIFVWRWFSWTFRRWLCLGCFLTARSYLFFCVSCRAKNTAACFVRLPGHVPLTHVYLALLSLVSVVPILLNFNSTPSSTLRVWPCPEQCPRWWALAVHNCLARLLQTCLILLQAPCTGLLIGAGRTVSAVVLKLACWGFQWLPVGYFRGFFFSGLLSSPTAFL